MKHELSERAKNERLQEYQPSQIGRERIVELNIEINNRFCHPCETLGSAKQQRIMDQQKPIGRRKPSEQNQTGQMPYKCIEEISQT